MRISAIEYDLRRPSMLHGKRGFERLIWASKNVLNNRITWLFVDLNAINGFKGQYKVLLATISQSLCRLAHYSAGPIEKFDHEVDVVFPTCQQVEACAIPLAEAKEVIVDPTFEEQLLEWLGLVLLDSPRVRANDEIDPYLCRYDIPEIQEVQGKHDTAVQTLFHVQWKGLAPSSFVLRMFLEIKNVSKKEWFALNASTFGGSSCVILCRNDREALTWDVEEAI